MNRKDIGGKIKNLAKGGFFHVLFGNTITKMVAFLSSIVIVRLVSKGDYADLAYADNIYSYINLLAGLGMATAILKYCAATKEKEEDKAYFAFAMKYGTICQLILSAVVLLYVFLVPIPFPEARILVLLLSLYPVLLNLFNTIMNYVRAHLDNQLFVRMSILQTVIVFLGSSLMVILIGIEGIVVARYIATAAGIIIAVPFLKKKLSGVKKIELSKEERKAFIRMAISLMIANLFSAALLSNEQLLVNYLIADKNITANYKVANLIPMQLNFVTSSIVVYYFPIIAQMQHGKKMWRKIKDIGLLTGGINAALVTIGIIISPFIVRIVYGSRYEDALGLFPIFWLIHGINSGLRIMPMNMLAAIGEAKFNALMSICTCIIHLGVDYIAIMRWGIEGVGVASGSVYVISGIIYWSYLYKKCHVHKKEK